MNDISLKFLPLEKVIEYIDTRTDIDKIAKYIE